MDKAERENRLRHLGWLAKERETLIGKSLAGGAARGSRGAEADTRATRAAGSRAACSLAALAACALAGFFGQSSQAAPSHKPVLRVALREAIESAPWARAEVIVRWRASVAPRLRSALLRGVRARVIDRGADGSALLRLRNASEAASAAVRLEASGAVRWATPNYRAHASFVPNDPAFSRQWHLSSARGIDAPAAWDLASQRGAPGGAGVTVAVVDTGVAYGNYRRCRCRRAPDLGTIVRGYDFVDDDRYPYDFNGHGTHVAETIVERTNNERAGAGIAYRAKVMPVRVLDDLGGGTAWTVAEGVRYAVRHGARIINLSVTLDERDRREGGGIGELQSALAEAERRGVLVVAAAGNDGRPTVSLPARQPTVLAVGAVTSNGCLAAFSNYGKRLDLVAPGGGSDSRPGKNSWDAAHCRAGRAGLDIFQETFLVPGRFDRFGLPAGYNGTSMAAAQVSAVAALVIAAGVLGPEPRPAALRDWLRRTATDIGARGRDARYGAGLLNARAALTAPEPATGGQ